MKLKLILIAVPAMFIATSAIAGSWTGVSVGLSVGENSGLNDLNFSLQSKKNVKEKICFGNELFVFFQT